VLHLGDGFLDQKLYSAVNVEPRDERFHSKPPVPGLVLGVSGGDKPETMTMKKILLGSVALIALGTASAFAADLPARTYSKAPAYVPAPIYAWTGFYIGGHVGGAFENNSYNGFGVTGNRSSFLGGGQIGADYQFAPNWVIGIEGTYSWVDLSRNATLGTLVINDRTRGLGSVTGRLGYTWGPALLYVKGGAGFRDNGNTSATLAGVPVAVTGNGNTTGYTVGAGLEYMFAPSWSAKLEYQYFNFGSNNVNVAAVPATVNVNRDINTVKLGVNYRFNWAGPVVAKY
jgi:outer membrane immunogenic protein